MEREKQEGLVGIEELADHFQVKKATVYDWTHRRRIPFYSGGKSLRFRISAVEAALFREPRPAAPARAPEKPGKRAIRPRKGKAGMPIGKRLLEEARADALQSGGHLPGESQGRR